LDYAGGFDCWVELFDLEQEKILETIKIDITSNPNKYISGHMADIILYVNPEYLNPKAKGKISPNFFKSKDYKLLIGDSAKIIENNVDIKRLS